MSYAVVIDFKNRLPRYAAKRLQATTLRAARTEADTAIAALRREFPTAQFEAQMWNKEDAR